jgi:nucleotide-binding universal stress UspA family protein
LADDVRVTLLHIVPGNLLAGERRHAERDAHKALADEIRHIRKQFSKKVTIQPLVKVGAAAKEIAACAIQAKAELIVMGRGGGRALVDTFLGSTAERVIRQARLPVLVVRLPARARYRRPALALGFDHAAHEVVHLMLRALPRPRPAVTVIHAYDIPFATWVYPSLSLDGGEEANEELQGEVSHDVLELLAATLADENVPPEDAPSWKTHIRYGSPRLVIQKAVRRAKTDLLVMGTRAHSGAAYVFLGTVAGDLLRQARCDVLVVPPAVARAAKRGARLKTA